MGLVPLSAASSKPFPFSYIRPGYNLEGWSPDAFSSIPVLPRDHGFHARRMRLTLRGSAPDPTADGDTHTDPESDPDRGPSSKPTPHAYAERRANQTSCARAENYADTACETQAFCHRYGSHDQNTDAHGRSDLTHAADALREPSADADQPQRSVYGLSLHLERGDRYRP